MQHQKICSEWFAVIFFSGNRYFSDFIKWVLFFISFFIFFPFIILGGLVGVQGFGTRFCYEKLAGDSGLKSGKDLIIFRTCFSFRGGVGVGGGFNTINMKGNKNVCKQIFHLVRYYTEIWIIGYIFTYVIFFVFTTSLCSLAISRTGS